MNAFAPFLLGLALLAACAPEPEPLPPVDPNVDLTPGWNDTEPDTCHASEFQYLIGQPSSALQTAGMTRAYRVIAPGGLVSQEYDAQRIDVQVDEAGLITRLTCG